MFKVGDKVRVRAAKPHWCGDAQDMVHKTATVRFVDDNGRVYFEQFKGIREFHLREEDLILHKKTTLIIYV